MSEHLQATDRSDSVVIIPTYNEKENIRAICEAVIALPHRFDLLVIDDQDGFTSLSEPASRDSALHT